MVQYHKSLELLTSFSEYPSQDSLTGCQRTEVCASLLERYSTTRQGDHVKAVMFWMIYVDLVRYYLLLDGACRTNDVDLYIFALSKICPIIFITHRPNYARYITRYLLNMINVENTRGNSCKLRRWSTLYSSYAKILYPLCC